MRKKLTMEQWSKAQRTERDGVIARSGVTDSMLRIELAIAFAAGVAWAFSDDGMAELIEDDDDRCFIN